VLRIHVECGQRGRRDQREGVELRAELAQRPHDLRAHRLVREDGGLDDHERASAEQLGHVGDRRELEQPPDGRDLVGHRVDPLAPGGEDLGGPLDRPEQHAGVDLGNREEGELECGRDPERAAAAAEGPEELRLVVAVGAHESGVRVDELDGDDAVRGQAVHARQPRDASAECVADDADVR
jgi:hypothetical protein